GDVSQPGMILASGLHSAGFTYGSNGQPQFTIALGPGTAAAMGVQVFVGNDVTSSSVPTLTGTPILAPTLMNPRGYAAYVQMHGSGFDFSGIFPGATLAMPDLTFVAPGTPLPALPGSAGPFRLPLTLYGPDNHMNPGNSISQAVFPLDTSVGL